MHGRNASFFMGRRRLEAAKIEIVVKRLNRAIDILVSNGITNFLTFGERGFDTLAASLILIKREKFNDIKLVLIRRSSAYLRPFITAPSTLPERMLFDVDRVVCISERRDTYVTKRASACIAYMPNQLGLVMRRKMLKECFLINVANTV